MAAQSKMLTPNAAPIVHSFGGPLRTGACETFASVLGASPARGFRLGAVKLTRLANPSYPAALDTIAVESRRWGMVCAVNLPTPSKKRLGNGLRLNLVPIPSNDRRARVLVRAETNRGGMAATDRR